MRTAVQHAKIIQNSSEASRKKKNTKPHNWKTAAHAVTSLGKSPCDDIGGTLDCLTAELCLHRREENHAVSLKLFSDLPNHMYYTYLHEGWSITFLVPQKCFVYMWKFPLPQFLLTSISTLPEKNNQAPFDKPRNYAWSVPSVAQFCQAMNSNSPYSVQEHT